MAVMVELKAQDSMEEGAKKREGGREKEKKKERESMQS